jgi:hypothetical protein
MVKIMTRFYIQFLLDKFYTKTSGDIGGKGEFYFKINGKRFPDKGVILLKGNETFDPEPNPTLYTAVLDDKEKTIKCDFEVWEEDPGRDDKFLDKEFKLPIKTMSETQTLSDKKGKVELTMIIKMAPTKN